MFAVRNIRLCTKDCLCLYVCPTGASDTENGQIDWSKCIGCGLCANACPSHAISIVPEKYPAQQLKNEDVVHTLNKLIENKTSQEAIADAISKAGNDPTLVQLAASLKRSNRYIAEDLFREAGYMLPQSKHTHTFLVSLLDIKDPAFPIDAVKELLERITPNET